MSSFPAQASGIREAIERAGIRVNHVEVSHYSAEHFGNLFATAETSLGRIEIVHDRQFEILAHDGLDQPTQERIILALEGHRRTSNW